MTPPIRVANEPRSFAPTLVLTSAPSGAVSSDAAGKTSRPMRFGDVTRNLTFPRKLDDR